MNLDDPKLLQEAAERLGINSNAIKAFVEAAAKGVKKVHTYYTKRDGQWMAGNLAKFADLGVNSLAMDSCESSMSPASFYQRCRYALTYIQEHEADFEPGTFKLAVRTRIKRRGAYVELHLSHSLQVHQGHAAASLPVTVTVREERLSKLYTAINRYIEAGHVTGKAFIQVADVDLSEEEQQKIKTMVPAGFVCAIAKGRNIVITKVKT